MHKKFEIKKTKIKGGCKSGRKVVPHDSKSDLPLGMSTGRLSSTPGIIYTLSKLGGVLWQEIEGNYVT